MGRRHANRSQRRALRAIYRTCAIEGCDVPFDRCEIHHIVPWELGGESDLESMLPVCCRHHRLLHQLGWRLDLAPDRTLEVTDGGGELLFVSRPDIPPDPVHRPPKRTAAA